MGLILKPFSKVTSIITPFDRANVDTDQIIPKQFLKLITKSGFGRFLFYDWRFNQDGKPKNDFVLNNSRYENFRFWLQMKILDAVHQENMLFGH